MICKVNGCHTETRAKHSKHGLCHRHYMRWWHHGDPNVILRGFGAEQFMAHTTPTIKQLYWAAGFLEGEACFYTNRSGHRCERIQVAQVDYEPVDTLHALFGGSLKPKKGRWEKQSDHWEWSVSGARARGIMMTIYQLMSTRRREKIRACLG